MKKLSLVILLLLVCLGLIAASDNFSASKAEAMRDGDPDGPFNLMIQVIDCDCLLLIWENPVYEFPPMGFRIYCNGNMVRYLAGSDVEDHYFENVCEGCHQFYVTAYYDTGCESSPSNIVEVTVTGNADNQIDIGTLRLNVYPNPSFGDVNIQLDGVKYGENEIAIMNVKGQKLRQIHLGNGQTGLWDGKDAQGRKVSEGIYYLKATTSHGSVFSKIILVR